MEIKLAAGGSRRQIDGHQCPCSRFPQLKPTRSKEAAMESLGAVETLLTQIRDWWRRRNELGRLDDKELQRVAAELGMSTNTLEDLVQRGPDAAHNLCERMQALGLSKADVDAAAHGVLRDLQRTCACCNEKSICERDLAERPEHPVWRSYCRNAVTLEALPKLKTHASV
jgi:hypothetical protein